MFFNYGYSYLEFFKYAPKKVILLPMNYNVGMEDEQNTMTERSSKTLINKSKYTALENAIIEECNNETYSVNSERKDNSQTIDMHSYNNNFVLNK